VFPYKDGTLTGLKTLMKKTDKW